MRVARGRARWENRDVRQVFPLPSERLDVPRFDGRYTGADGQTVEFSADASLRWNGESGVWSVHGGTLQVSAGTRAGEGAIDASGIYLLCRDGETRESRSQLVLRFDTDRP